MKPGVSRLQAQENQPQPCHTHTEEGGRGREKGSTEKPNKVQHITLTLPMTCLNPQSSFSKTLNVFNLMLRTKKFAYFKQVCAFKAVLGNLCVGPLTSEWNQSFIRCDLRASARLYKTKAALEFSSKNALDESELHKITLRKPLECFNGNPFDFNFKMLYVRHFKGLYVKLTSLPYLTLYSLYSVLKDSISNLKFLSELCFGRNQSELGFSVTADSSLRRGCLQLLLFLPTSHIQRLYKHCDFISSLSLTLQTVIHSV